LSSQCQCPAGSIAVSAGCDGDYCDKVTWSCAAVKDDMNNSYEVSGDLQEAGSTNNSTNHQVMCPKNTAAAFVGCGGSYCDNMNLKCSSISAKTFDGQTAPVTFEQVGRWTEWFPTSSGKKGTCPEGNLIRGLVTYGQFSQFISLYCSPGSTMITTKTN
jgi:hypothetical protein